MSSDVASRMMADIASQRLKSWNPRGNCISFPQLLRGSSLLARCLIFIRFRSRIFFSSLRTRLAIGWMRGSSFSRPSRFSMSSMFMAPKIGARVRNETMYRVPPNARL